MNFDARVRDILLEEEMIDVYWQKLNEFALLKTISTTHIRAKNQYFEAPDWYVNLAAFIKNIHSRINVPDSIQIKKPIIKGKKVTSLNSFENKPHISQITSPAL